jgi:hypothetical protein
VLQHTQGLQACGTARKYGAKRCAAPNLPAEELEELITESLLDAYRDNALFDEAITRHLAGQGAAREPLEEELASVNGTIAEKIRVLRRYQDDYETGDLSAARYESRSAELEDDLVSLNSRAADLEMQLRGFELAPRPPLRSSSAYTITCSVASGPETQASARPCSRPSSPT